MTADDHAAVVALAQGIADRDGYIAQQSSDMYVSDGDGDDWAYHSQGVFRITLEMAPGSAAALLPDAGRAERRRRPQPLGGAVVPRAGGLSVRGRRARGYLLRDVDRHGRQSTN